MFVFRAAILIAFLILASRAIASDLTAEQLSFFEAKIRPVLIKECYSCHSSKAGNVRGGLRLDTQALMHIGGSTGPAIVPGNLDESLLYSAILHQDFEMPPKRKLSQSVIEDFRRWIEMGAPDPRVSEVGEIKPSISESDIQEARKNFWAYQPPVKRKLPAVADASWPSTDIDHFILDKLEAAALSPAPDAEPTIVLRRLCFDLIGLPPSPKQIEDFRTAWEKDPSRAIAGLVDQLLESTQYGERWGRHWLDVARYAESTGREVNMTYSNAWRYRDYVIDSFNADKPYNEFVQEQIAGDLLPAKSDPEWAEQLIATTFLAIGPKNVNEQNRVQFAADVADEQIDATTRVFLGMSVSCARCHDHKFDAIPQADYYALAGIFGNLATYFGNPPSELGGYNSVQQRQNSSLIRLPVEDANPFDKHYSPEELESLKAEIVAAQKELAEIRRTRPGEGGPDAAGNSQRMRIVLTNKLAELTAKLAVVDSTGAPLSFCMGVQEKGTPKDKPLLVRGEIDLASRTIARGLPQVLCTKPIAIEPNQSGRLQLARWLGSDENTLAARVMVNRIWQYLLGKGIVDSTENFGVTGQAPSHPELLDYLSVRFVESGWSVKSLIRDITNSRVYRIQSIHDDRSHEADPDNALLWRAHSRRLDAEAIRDAMLTISNEIELQPPRGSEVAKAGYTRVRDGILGDPRELIRQATMEAGKARAAEAMRGRLRTGLNSAGRLRFPFNAPAAGSSSNVESLMSETMRKLTHQLDMEEAKYRSVYLPIVRDEVPRSLEVFDFADADSIVGTRESSNTPNQALYMLNNRFVIQQSDAFARRIATENAQLKDQIESAFLLAFARPPTQSERAATQTFLRSFATVAKSRSAEAATGGLSAFCQSLLASAEFRTIE